MVSLCFHRKNVRLPPLFFSKTTFNVLKQQYILQATPVSYLMISHFIFNNLIVKVDMILTDSLKH